MPRAEYRSAQRSRQLIIEALIALAETKPLFKITVTDIVNTAEISRSTFYTHYEDIDDLVNDLEEYAVGELEKVLADIKKNFSSKGIHEALIGISDTLEKDKNLNQVLFSSDDTSIVAKMRRCFADYMMDNDAIPAVIRASSRFNAMIQFFAGGAANLYQAWFRGELSGSLHDIADLLTETLMYQIAMFSNH